MDKKALIAILLCAVVWAVYMQTNYTRQQRLKAKAGDASPTATAVAGATSATGATAMPVVTGTSGAVTAVAPGGSGTDAGAGGVVWPVTTAELSNKVLDLKISSVGARPVSADLKQYRRAAKLEETDLVQLVHVKGTVAPLAPWFGTSDASLIPADAGFEQLSGAGENKAIFRWKGANGLQVTRTYSAQPEGYVVDLEERFENTGSAAILGRPGVVWASSLKGVKTSWLSPGEADFNSAAVVNDRKQDKNAKKPGEDRIFGGPVEWIGIEDRYFLAAAIPVEPKFEGKDAVRFFRPGPDSVAALALGPESRIEPGASHVFKHQLYLGPKDYKVLKDAGHGLDRSIAWGGVLTPISKGLWHLLHWFHSWAKNWGLSIVLLTFVIRGLLSPLAAKQMKLSNEFAAKSAKLKPQLDKLREKLKDDPMKLNSETMLLYKQHGLSPFSPLAGCLPILIQMPIWFALYRVLWASIDLRQAPFALWIQDLSAPDPWKVLPIALGAVTFVQMKLTPNTGMDPQQAKMMLYMMPLMFTVPMIGLPAGLVLYIFTSTVMNIAQQWYLRRVIPRADTTVAAPGRAT